MSGMVSGCGEVTQDLLGGLWRVSGVHKSHYTFCGYDCSAGSR